MSSRGRARFISIILAISVFLAGCTSTVLPRGQDAVWHLVIIGDSTLWGVGDAYGVLIKRDIKVKVDLRDFSIGGLSAGQVREVLQTGKSLNARLEELPTALIDAEVVVMFVNPENPLNQHECFELVLSNPPISCSPVSLEKWTSDLKAIWAEIFKLRRTILRAVDIYNPSVKIWGKYGVFEACTECWVNQSNAVRLAAETHNIPFHSRYDAFNGMSHSEDPIEK